MSNVFDEYPVNGVGPYAITFEYQQQEDVVVLFKKISDDSYVLQSNTDWSFENETSVLLNSAPSADYDEVRLQRSTSVNPLNATFYPGSAIRAQDLNANFEQLMFAIEEEKATLSEVITEAPDDGQTYGRKDKSWVAINTDAVSYRGVWSQTSVVPSPAETGYFWVWGGADDATLNNASWGTINGSTIDSGDRLYYNGTSFEIIPGGGSGSTGVLTVTGNAPINITGSSTEPVVNISNATTSAAGAMSAADKTKLDGLTNPDLSYTTASTNGFVNITNGNSATIPAATQSTAGLLTAGDKTKLDGIPEGGGSSGVTKIVAGTNVTISPTSGVGEVTITSSGGGGGGATNLSWNNVTTSTGQVTSDTGNNATLTSATTSLAGLMSSTDKQTLDGVSSTYQTKADMSNYLVKDFSTLDLLP